MRTRLLLVLPLLAACHHVSRDGAGVGSPSGPGPAFSGSARFLDVDRDGRTGPGDLVIVRFNAPVAVNTSDPAALALPVAGDGFGAGASLAAGPRPDEVSVTLGTGAVLRTRGWFDPGDSSHRRPSGLNIADDAPPDSIENAGTGVDAEVGDEADLWPVPVPGILSGLGPSALQVAGADLNRDGLDDLVAADGANGVDVYESLASGGYTSFNLSAGDAREVLPVDLFGAGRQDLAVRSATQLISFENLSPPGGPVTIGTAEVHDLPEAMTALADIDWDHDGDRDLLLAGASGLWLFLNRGDGSLEAPLAPLSGSPAGGRDLAVGDVDRNGWQDVLVALPGPNAVLRRLPCSSFELGAQGQGDSHHVALVDLDRDGHLDAVSAGVGPIEVGSGSAQGVFEPAYDLPADVTSALCVHDLDGDSAPDLLLSDGFETIALGNDGAGGLIDVGSSLETGGVESIGLADVDGDGDHDLALAGAGMPQVWAASRTGTWGDPRLRRSPAEIGTGALLSLASADIDGDGVADLAYGRSLRIELRRGLGDATFAEPTLLLLDQGRAHDLAFADVDGDGDQDLAVALLGLGANLWLNDGAGGFLPLVLEGAGEVHRETSVTLGDLTGDGFPELLLGTVGGHSDRVFPNGGGSCRAPGPADGTFWQGFDPPIDLPGEASTNDIALADVDLDGDQDALFAHAGSNPDRLFLNDGAGQLSLSTQVFPPRETRSLTLADVDRDGDPDLVAGMPSGNLLFFGDGAGAFAVAGTVDGVATFATHLVPLDGDGLPDLLVGHDLHHGWQAFLGTPDGHFSGGTDQRAAAFSIRAMAVGDLDRDGALDFVHGTGQPQEPNRVWVSR